MKKLFAQIIVFFLASTPLFADCIADFEFVVDGATVDFTDGSFSDEGDISYYWTFGDGSTSNEANPAHIYSEPGTYTSCLIIETTGGCVADKCETIVIGGDIFCEADFDYTVDGLTVHFTNASVSGPGDIISYEWSFGDAGSSTFDNPTHTYAVEGTYNVCLEIITADGCVDVICYTVTLGGGVGECEADFEFITDGLNAMFNDNSIASGDIISWSWDFGDGSTSTLENPTHIYDILGTYTVCLIITTNDGCISDICKSVSVGIAGGDCSATFDFEVDGETIHFFSTTDPGPGDVIEYSWDFGDGTFGDGENPVHTYTEPGVYEVCLTVHFAGGCIAVFCTEVLIAGDADCTAMFEIIGTDSADIHFFGTVDPEPDEVTYTWTFGDGSSFTETIAGGASDPWHEYAEPGIYVVCLVIETGGGCIDEYCQEIVVEFGVGADCASSYEFTNDGLTVHFYETADGDVIDYHWDFGDGDVSDDANPTHVFDFPGVYTICLTITTADSCIAEYCLEIEVSAAGGDCESDFEFTEDGLLIHFFETADGGGADITEYHWSFGDGTFSDDANPAHTYIEEGVYVICLTILTADGCEATFCDEITVETGGGGDCEAGFEIISMELTADGWVVNYENTSTAAADIATVIWYFGDGSTADSYDAEHLYLAAGTYLVCVVISTVDGCTSEYCIELFIGAEADECESDFEWEADGLTVDFFETAAGGGADIISYVWTFDDGTGDVGGDITHIYDVGGGYEVCLTIITVDSCIDTHCEEIHIEGEPAPCTAGFEIESIEETPDGWVFNFTNTSEGTGPGSEIYHWTFGDGGVSDGVDPEHLYTEPGIYLICVTIGEFGADCYDEYCEEIFIGGDDDCIDSTMIVPGEDCSGDEVPVCGCDGITYENACVAQYHHGVMFFTEGACDLTTIVEENIFAGVLLSPNPAQNEVNIKYTLLSDAEVKIDIVDLIGKQLTQIYNQQSIAGIYNFQYNTTDLAASIYSVRISAGADQTVQKLVITK